MACLSLSKYLKRLFCAVERNYLGTGARLAQDEHEGNDEQLPKVMTRVAGSWIGKICMVARAP